MGVTVSWDDDAKTIVRYVFADPWNWDQFYPCWNWVKEAMDTSPPKVSAIIDLTGSHSTPANSLMHIRALMQQIHPNFSGAVVLVGAGQLGAIYGNVAQQVTTGRYRLFFTNTLEEARHLLDDWKTQQNSKGS